MTSNCLSTTLANSDLACEFVVVETKEDFRQALQSGSIDLALVDYSLPTFNGMEAIQLASAQFPLIPCILVSGVLGEERAIEALKNGAVNYVLKQRLDRLVPAVKQALKEAEEKRLFTRAVEELRKNEARFRTSIESMTDCVAILSVTRDSVGGIQDFLVEYINEMAAKYLLVLPDEYIGKSFYSLLPSLKNIENNALFSELCFAVDGGRPYQDEIYLRGWKNQNLAADSWATGEQTAAQQAVPRQFVAIEMKAAKLDDGLVVTWRDITQRKMLEQQSMERLQEAESSRNRAVKASKYKDDLLARFTHELRSPISNISGSLQLLETNKQSNALSDKVLEVIQRNAKSLECLASDLLDGSRIDRGKFRCDLEPTDLDRLNQTVLGAINTLKPGDHNKSVQIFFEPAALSGQLFGDTARLKQVIQNLLSNAIKFTPASGASTGKITIEIYQQSKAISICVKDTGKGMSPEVASHVFDRRWQMEHSPGTAKSSVGLGLSIAKHIVDAHGGRITAKSDGINQGSTFTVELPLLAETNPVAVTAPSATSSADRLAMAQVPSLKGLADDGSAVDIAVDEGIQCSLKNVRVLVVDDKVDSIDVCKMMLEMHDAEVKEASTADEALKILRQFRPHVIVSDIAMPDKDGYDMIRQVRALPDYDGGRIPAIAVSAYTSEIDRTRALLAGFQLHIPKPIDFDNIVKSVALFACRDDLT